MVVDEDQLEVMQMLTTDNNVEWSVGTTDK